LADIPLEREKQKRGLGASRPVARTPVTATITGTVAPARAVAAHILLMVERGTAHSDDLLHTPRAAALSRQDRDLMTQLVLGTLRWERVLDREIAARLTKPDAEMHFGVIVALRLGAYQLLFLDRIPAHAAIGESVELAKQADGQYAAGMVNAVLRRMGREQDAGTVTDRTPEAAHPEWMVARWQARFGVEATSLLCAYDQVPAPITLRLLDERAEASLASAGVVLAPGEFLGQARRVLSGDINGSAALASGWARIQDEASQLVAELASRAAGKEVLDTCAAPGGKTAILLERLPDANVTAMDLSETRLRMMRRRMPGEERLRTVAGDAAALPAEPAYDAILCDVPCSGTGTLARNPEIRHRLQPESFSRRHQRQIAILSASLAALKPGGRLVYSTCSLEPEEDEQVVEEVLSNLDGYTLPRMEDELSTLAAAGVVHIDGLAHLRSTALSGPYLRTIPGVHGCDGFFAAIIVRT
jgi:16S rRNA (cytosine967-C5)-methyltransferase